MMRFIRIFSLVAAAIIFSISIGALSSASAFRKTGLGAVEVGSAAFQESKPAPDSYKIDPVHSSIGFTVRHLVISKVPGHFKDFTGTINYDPSDASRSSVEFTAKIAGVDTGNEQRDNHLRSADFFDAEKHPEMTFRSSKVESKGNNHFVVYGAFSLKGVTKEIAIPFELFGPIKDPRGNMRIGVEAALTINRQDYGVSWSRSLDNGSLVVSNEVSVDLRLEAIKPAAAPAGK